MDAGDRRHRARRAEQMEARRSASSSATRSTNGASASATWAVMAAKSFVGSRRRRRTSRPARRRRAAATPRPRRGPRRSARRDRKPSQMISDDPPPMSNITVDLGLAVGEIADARGGEMRLGLAVDDLERRCRARRAPRSTNAGAVRGRAAGLGRDAVRARVTPRAAILSRQTLQRLERARDRRFAQPPGLRQTLAQPDDARERVDHPESVRRRPRDQQPAIVGAQIQRRISPRRPLRRRPADSGARRRVGPEHLGLNVET